MSLEIINTVKDYTIVSQDRLKTIYNFAQICSHLDGDAAELGVYRGGVSMLLRMLVPDHKQVLAFDSYNGIPNWDNTIDKSAHKNGDFAIKDKNETIERLTKLNITPVVGLFKDMCTQFNNSKFAMAHFDGDSHQSCKEFLEFFWPRLSVGGVMIFDDLDWLHTPGVRIALDSWLELHPNVELAKPAKYQGMLVKQ